MIGNSTIADVAEGRIGLRAGVLLAGRPVCLSYFRPIRIPRCGCGCGCGLAAGALGAGAMSLYHYVASKEELLDAMIDVVFEKIELPPEESDGQSAMRRRAVSVRQVLARPPWVPIAGVGLSAG